MKYKYLIILYIFDYKFKTNYKNMVIFIYVLLLTNENLQNHFIVEYLNLFIYLFCCC
jgi:hypothetical protein